MLFLSSSLLFFIIVLPPLFPSSAAEVITEGPWEYFLPPSRSAAIVCDNGPGIGSINDIWDVVAFHGGQLDVFWMSYEMYIEYDLIIGDGPNPLTHEFSYCSGIEKIEPKGLATTEILQTPRIACTSASSSYVFLIRNESPVEAHLGISHSYAGPLQVFTGPVSFPSFTGDEVIGPYYFDLNSTERKAFPIPGGLPIHEDYSCFWSVVARSREGYEVGLDAYVGVYVVTTENEFDFVDSHCWFEPIPLNVVQGEVMNINTRSVRDCVGVNPHSDGPGFIVIVHNHLEAEIDVVVSHSRSHQGRHQSGDDDSDKTSLVVAIVLPIVACGCCLGCLLASALSCCWLVHKTRQNRLAQSADDFLVARSVFPVELEDLTAEDKETKVGEETGSVSTAPLPPPTSAFEMPMTPQIPVVSDNVFAVPSRGEMELKGMEEEEENGEDVNVY